jgi:predicted acylesterase/phospholipase RssA
LLAIAMFFNAITERLVKHGVFKRLILSGGGAKGGAYLGAYLALEKWGLLNNLEIVAGASAGSIIAAFAAVSMSAVKLRELLLNQNFKALLGSPGKLLNKDGKPLEQLIRNALIETVRDFLVQNRNDQVFQASLDFKSLVGKFIEKEATSFTFADLAKLTKLFPSKFKRFVTLAVEAETGDIQVFNCEDTPGVDIALACRASASIPVILAAVEIEIENKKKKFVDGGMVDNFPDYFDKNLSGWYIKNQEPDKTLVIGFSEGLDHKKNPLFQALHGKPRDQRKTEFYCPSSLEKIKRNCLPTCFGIRLPFKNTQQKNKGFEKISEFYSLNTLALRVGDIKTTDFADAQKYAREMAAFGYLDSITYFINYGLVLEADFEHFYVSIMHEFQTIYSTLKGENWKKDSELGRKIIYLEGKLQKEQEVLGKDINYNIITREAYYFLRDWVESHLNSNAAFALCRAVEIYNGQLDKNDLRKEIKEKRQPGKVGKIRTFYFFRSRKEGTAAEASVNNSRQISCCI